MERVSMEIGKFFHSNYVMGTENMEILKVVIADDEVRICQLIQALIDWAAEETNPEDSVIIHLPAITYTEPIVLKEHAVNLTGSYEIVCMCVDTRLDSEHDICSNALFFSNFIKSFQFIDIVNYDSADVEFYCIFQFLVSLVVSVEANLVKVRTCFVSCVEFTD